MSRPGNDCLDCVSTFRSLCRSLMHSCILLEVVIIRAVTEGKNGQLTDQQYDMKVIVKHTLFSMAS